MNAADSGALTFGVPAATLGGLTGSRGVNLGSATLSIGANNVSTTYTGSLSGGGGLTKVGSGVLTLGGSDSYGGPTNVSSGTLQMLIAGAGNGIPDTSAVAIAASATLDINGTSETIGPLSGSGNVTLGSSTLGNLTVNSTGDSTFSGVISGAGSFWKSGPAALTLSGQNTYSGDTRIPAGTLRIGTSLTLQNSTLDMNAADAGVLDMNGINATLGGLKGTGGVTLIANHTLSIGNDNQATTYSGTLTGSGSLAKIGSGTSTVLGSSNFSGATTIASGALDVGGGGGLSPNSNLVFNAAGGGLPVLEQNGTFSLSAGTAPARCGGSAAAVLPPGAARWPCNSTAARPR